MKRKEHVLDLMQDLHVPKYLRGVDAYQQQKRKREREHEKVKRLRRRWTRSHEYPAPLPTDAPPFPLEGNDRQIRGITTEVDCDMATF